MKEGINSFPNYLAVEKGFSENTVAAYRNDLYQLASFVEEEATKPGSIPSWASFGRQGMLSYLLNLNERGIKGVRMISNLNKFSMISLR